MEFDRKRRILVVDDDEEVRKVLREMVETLGHEVEEARDGLEALAILELDIDLVLLDVMMPNMDGFEAAEKIRQQYNQHELPIIMITGLTGRNDRIRAVEAGANDFVAKPFDITEIRARTTSLLRLKVAHDTLKRHQIELEGTVRRRTSSLRRALDDVVDAQRKLQKAYRETIHRLVVAAEYKDIGTAAHIRRMSAYSAMIARETGMQPSKVEIILHASPMHDIGKIGTPESILLKPGKLDEYEWELMKQHPSIGAHILEDSSSELLRTGEIIALTHHERWDGSGYPKRLDRENIPLEGRISAIADVFDALTSKRPYKRAFSNDEAIRILREGRGGHFQPDLVDLFIDNIEEVVDIQHEVAKTNSPLS